MTKPPQSSPPHPSHNDDIDFEEALADVERQWESLVERYAQIKRDRDRQAQLENRREDIWEQTRENPLPELKEELGRIKRELETIEVNLESSLFSWGSLKEPFWQAVRFGGLGIVLGWLLKSCVR
jgi:hypothetical protein